MVEPQAVLARAFDQLAGPAADRDAKQLSAAREVLLSQPAVLLESHDRLAQVATSGDAAAYSWVAETYAAVVGKCPVVEALVSALNVGSIGLQHAENSGKGIQAIATALQAIYQENAFVHEDSRLGAPLLAAMCAVASLLESGPLSAQISALKLADTISVMLTAPAAHNKLGMPAAQVSGQVQATLKQLLRFLRGAKGGGQSSCLSLAAIHIAQHLLLQRPGQAGRVLPTLLSLATAALPDANKPSLQRSLQRALLALWRTSAPELQAWKPKIRDALGSLGVTVEASKPEREEEQSPVPTAGAQPQAVPSQRAAPQEPAGVQWPQQQQQPQPQPQQQPQQQQQQQFQPQAAASSVGVTAQPEIDHVLAIVAALLAENDQATCMAFVNGLPPEVLADVVIANMRHLPSRESVLPSAAAPSGNGAALLAGLVQAAGPQPTAQEQAPPRQPPPQVSQPAVAPSATTAAPLKVSAAAQPAKAVARKPAPPPAAIHLRPMQLSAAQQAACWRGALKRLVTASSKPCRGLQSSLIARLAPQLQEESWMRELVDDFLQRKDDGGFELALKLLDALFAASPAGPDASPGGSDVQGDATSTSSQVQPSAAYVQCLQLLLKAFREKLPAKDRSISQLLVEAPALPPQLLAETLDALLAQGADYATLALVTARDVIMLRPGSRQPALQALLQMAVSADQDVRGKAVRLVANKVFPNPVLTGTVETFATARLRLLVDQGGPGKRDREEAADEDSASAAKKARMVDSDDAAVAARREPPHANGGGKPDDAGNGAEAQPPEHGVENGGGEREQDEASDKERQATATEAAACECELYCALCTKRHALLRDLFAVFGRATEAGRAAVLKNAEGLARVLGGAAPALLALIDDTPDGAQTLLLRMLYFLTEAHPPPQALVDACRRRYDSSRDASLLPPALGGMPKEEIRSLLPRVLEPTSLLNAALDRILLPLPSGGSSMTATEVLLALLGLEPAKDGVRLKSVMVALDTCLSRRAVFDKETLASALQQLNQWPALPPLYMRFLMQCQASAPDLKPFLLEQLAVLVSRQIWTDKTLFTGWNLAVRQNVPDSFPAFLQLPTRVLTEALQTAPAAFRTQLRDYASSPACPANQQGPILRVLDSITT